MSDYQTFLIRDWAGNTMFDGKTFKTFEDAWEFLYEQFNHLEESEFEEQMGEFEVEVTA